GDFAWAHSIAVRISRGRGRQPSSQGGASSLVRTSSHRFSANRTARFPGAVAAQFDIAANAPPPDIHKRLVRQVQKQ
ncbi:hypothetical protein, partial [Neptuniibacter sp.]|uniref:hypothetical protein n=1 Tax=Neptuniibacter sp. TaxID=1962643 RepID=UPI0026298F74